MSDEARDDLLSAMSRANDRVAQIDHEIEALRIERISLLLVLRSLRSPSAIERVRTSKTHSSANERIRIACAVARRQGGRVKTCDVLHAWIEAFGPTDHHSVAPTLRQSGVFKRDPRLQKGAWIYTGENVEAP